MSDRRPLLAKVHIARKELGLAEEDYRSILARVAGSDSARTCGDKQLRFVLDEFRRLGWKPKTAAPSGKRYVRMIYAIWHDMAPLLGSGGSREALRTFVRRQTKTRINPDGVSAPEFLDGHQANRVIEGLKAWKDRLERGGASC